MNLPEILLEEDFVAEVKRATVHFYVRVLIQPGRGDPYVIVSDLNDGLSVTNAWPELKEAIEKRWPWIKHLARSPAWVEHYFYKYEPAYDEQKRVIMSSRDTTDLVIFLDQKFSGWEPGVPSLMKELIDLVAEIRKYE